MAFWGSRGEGRRDLREITLAYRRVCVCWEPGHEFLLESRSHDEFRGRREGRRVTEVIPVPVAEQRDHQFGGSGEYLIMRVSRIQFMYIELKSSLHSPPNNTVDLI